MRTFVGVPIPPLTTTRLSNRPLRPTDDDRTSLATRAQGPHPFPSRTRPLSPAAPMVLRPRERGRVGRRRHPFRSPRTPRASGASCTPHVPRRRPCVPTPHVARCRPPASRRAPHDRAPGSSPSSAPERRQVDAPQPHRGREAQHHEPEAAVRPATASSASGPRTASRWSSSTRRGCSTPKYALHEAMRATALEALARRRRDRATSPTRSRACPCPLAEAAAAERRAARADPARPQQDRRALDQRRARRLRGAAPERAVRLAPRPATASTRSLDATRRAPAGEPVPLSRGRDQHAADALLRRRARARDGARAARRRGAVQRRRARSRSTARTAPRCTFGRCSTSSGRARRASSSARAGARIREIGRVARGKVETLVGGAVYLDLWVKVLPNWRRRSASALRRFGYHLHHEKAPMSSRHSCSTSWSARSARGRSTTGPRSRRWCAPAARCATRSATTFRSC